jgi:hypothetical protein
MISSTAVLSLSVLRGRDGPTAISAVVQPIGILYIGGGSASRSCVVAVSVYVDVTDDRIRGVDAVSISIDIANGGTPYRCRAHPPSVYIDVADSVTP